MAKPKHDPLGAEYWELTEDQKYLGGALTDDWLPLRDVVKKASEDTSRPVTGHVRWEKLFVFGVLAVDKSRQDDVYVKRGDRWQQWWDASGLTVTALQDLSHDLSRKLDELNL